MFPSMLGIHVGERDIPALPAAVVGEEADCLAVFTDGYHGGIREIRRKVRPGARTHSLRSKSLSAAPTATLVNARNAYRSGCGTGLGGGLGRDVH